MMWCVFVCLFSQTSLLKALYCAFYILCRVCSHCSLRVFSRFRWARVCLKCVSTPPTLTCVGSWGIFRPLSRVWPTAWTGPGTTSNCRRISASLLRKVNKTSRCRQLRINKQRFRGVLQRNRRTGRNPAWTVFQCTLCWSLPSTPWP